MRFTLPHPAMISLRASRQTSAGAPGLLLGSLLPLALVAAGCARSETGPASRATAAPPAAATAKPDPSMPETQMGVVEEEDGPIRAIPSGGAAGRLGALMAELPPVPDVLREAPAVVAAAENLAAGLDLPADEIVVLAVEEVTWPNSGLGCPKPGMMYAQVLTPGYRVTLQAGSQAAIYHTDRSEVRAPAVVRCDPGQESDAGLRMLSGDALDQIRMDMETRFEGAQLSLVTTRVAPVSSLDCSMAGTLSGREDEGPVGSAADGDLPRVVIEHVFEFQGERHLYRSWLDAYVYCGQLAEPFAPPSED
jgi:hypothetical protein